MTSGPGPVVHPILRGRWSPRTFDPDHVATEDDVAALLEAARWAPSAGNSQPWSFVVGLRGDAIHQRLVRHLTRSTAAWAPAASLLVANLCHRFVEGTDWDYSEFASYDLGQAVAHMAIEAQARGLATRQFRAFDRDGLSAEFAVPDHWEVTTMTAVGAVPQEVEPHAATLPDGRLVPRDRRELQDLLWTGGFLLSPGERPGETGAE